MEKAAVTDSGAAFRDQLVLKMNDLFNNKNFKIIDEVLSDDCVNKGPLGQTYGVIEFKHLFCLPLFNAFPDLTFVCHEVICEVPSVVMRWTFTGTHKGDFRGYKPTNQKVCWSGVVVNRINEVGLVYEMQYYFDSRPLYNQLANVPAAPSSAV